MQRLNRGMLSRYEIPEHIPAAVNTAQFGLSERLLGVADRLIDTADAGIGIVCVLPEGAPPDGNGIPAALLGEQDGLYTLLIKGYRGESPVVQETVVQSVARVIDSGDALRAEAVSPDLVLGLVDTQSDALDAELLSAAQLLAARHGTGLPGLSFVCLGESAGCAALAREAIAALAGAIGAQPGFAGWLQRECEFFPALAEGLVRRADAAEAAKQCAAMNYADGMLHLAEPFARLTVQAPAAFRSRWPLDRAEGIRFTDDLAPALALKHRLYDAGLFAMAAPGWLLGCDTLYDCMKHERLRAFVGRAWMEELLPAEPGAREAGTEYAIQCFERFENPLTRNPILWAGRYLLRRFTRGALPLMRDWAGKRFEPPRRLSFALAATIMLYAGARPGTGGRYEVARGSETQRIQDDPEALAAFAAFSHDMDPSALAYAALADRELWGADLRDIEGLEQRVALDIANIQRNPAFLPD